MQKKYFKKIATTITPFALTLAIRRSSLFFLKFLPKINSAKNETVELPSSGGVPKERGG
ncbi:hypothetical protein FSS13T_27090 [Flavobacterium saliperosum S13]|uniref:Uncharacterized protein n=1 Tax=Flavobacterium saliperosum S13 TaxID=1341155 RepID=A0ABN0QDF0_9FLAO|nr:hypothetical protein FSS13T_27090 [Flavobacterium saliperosum S13]